MRQLSQQKMWFFSALIFIGALVACSPVQTPVAVATSTVIASTATATATPNTPTSIPPASSTPITLSTQSSQAITPILDSTVEFEIDFTEAIIDDLANILEISSNRIQLVSVEVGRWGQDSLGCDITQVIYDEMVINHALSEKQVDGLRYILLVGDILYEYHTENTERYQRCLSQNIVSGEVLVAVDPLAAETLRVVQMLLATELDLSSRRVQLVDMLPVTWTDTSLGCPQEGQTYTQVDIQGYHIVVSVADDRYIYHSDSNTAYPCPLDQSIISAN